jgi:hypothetical protein
LLVLRWYSQSDAMLSSNQWQPVILRQQYIDQAEVLHFTPE